MKIETQQQKDIYEAVGLVVNYAGSRKYESVKPRIEEIKNKYGIKKLSGKACDGILDQWLLDHKVK